LTNEKQELPVAAMFIKQISTKSAIFIDNLPKMLPTMSRFIWQSGFRVEDFLEINQSETRIALGELGVNKCFINDFLLSGETFWLCHRI
jgi:hypothetical protein